MPDSDPLSPREPPASEPSAGNEPRPLPAPGSEEIGDGEADGWFTRALRGVFGGKPGSMRADLRAALEARARNTGFSPKETAMLQNILVLRERRVEDVMIPRADIIAVQKDIALGELMKVFASAGHSRLVVFEDSLDDAMGMVHIRDLVAFMTERAAAAPGAADATPLPAELHLDTVDLAMSLSDAKIIRPILFIPPSMPAVDLLGRMQASRIHLALVIDEYGGADGIVSIEDLVEQIVGDIEDEHDEDEAPSVVRQPDGSFLADARASLEDVTAVVGADFDVGEVANEVDTLAGYIASRIGRVPLRGELVPGPGRYEIEVLDADPRRVKRLKIMPSTGRIKERAAAARRRPDAASAPMLPPPPPPQLPITRDASVKLSPDAAPPKAQGRS
jgi:CBS domain containing-hemolysin-like protein